MRTSFQSHFDQRSLIVNHPRDAGAIRVVAKRERERIRQNLLRLGMSKFRLRSLASQYLPHVIHAHEQLGGVVYGHDQSGSAMLVATDRRIIYLSKKPFYVNEDELTYDVVSGVSFTHAGLGSSVTLHTRIKDFTIRTLNRRSSEIFMEYIELRCLVHNRWEARQ